MIRVVCIEFDRLNADGGCYVNGVHSLDLTSRAPHDVPCPECNRSIKFDKIHGATNVPQCMNLCLDLLRDVPFIQLICTTCRHFVDGNGRCDDSQPVPVYRPKEYGFKQQT